MHVVSLHWADPFFRLCNAKDLLTLGPLFHLPNLFCWISAILETVSHPRTQPVQHIMARQLQQEQITKTHALRPKLGDSKLPPPLFDSQLPVSICHESPLATPKIKDLWDVCGFWFYVTSPVQLPSRPLRDLPSLRDLPQQHNHPRRSPRRISCAGMQFAIPFLMSHNAGCPNREKCRVSPWMIFVKCFAYSHAYYFVLLQWRINQSLRITSTLPWNHIIVRQLPKKQVPQAQQLRPALCDSPVASSHHSKLEAPARIS